SKKERETFIDIIEKLTSIEMLVAALDSKIAQVSALPKNSDEVNPPKNKLKEKKSIHSLFSSRNSETKNPTEGTYLLSQQKNKNINNNSQTENRDEPNDYIKIITRYESRIRKRMG